MPSNAPTQLRIGICGSASVGKTSLVNALASDLTLPCLREEMRDYLESTGAKLADMPAPQVSSVLTQLWKKREEKELQTNAFIADNCPLDFAAYALYYGCLNDENSGVFLSKTLDFISKYDAICVLPWGILPYTEDGVRPASQHLQLRYQLILEGLLRKYVSPQKLHFLPEGITDLTDRCRWARSVTMLTELPQRVLNLKQVASKGFVYLVGAGPGDPRLLTVRAIELIQRADVIAYDLLVSPEILARVPAHVDLLPVGRRHGEGTTSYRLHPDVLARAQAGQVVVRLKCGDPLLFGRGGEEAEELVEANIPFEIVPGISAAFGAAAYAGIPLTHRSYASEVLFRTGHDAPDTKRPSFLSMPQKSADCRTTVLYMAARRLQENIDGLLSEGYAPATPAAVVASATTPRQQVIVSTLATLSQKVKDIEPDVPALFIVGHVAGLREKIARFENISLQSLRILIARARPGISAIAERLRSLKASVVEAPSVTTAPLEDWTALDAALARLHHFDAVVFGCADGVRYTLPRLASIPSLSAIAIGDQANHALVGAGITPRLAVSGNCHNALEKQLTTFAGKRLLLITSDKGRPGLSNELINLSATVETAASYQIRYNFDALPKVGGEFDLIILPSSTATELLLKSESGASLKHLPMIAMGPVTEASARKHGASRLLRAPHDSIDSIVSCVMQFASPATHLPFAEQPDFTGVSL
jgi:uroporphyrin-III C-methyltransferase